MEMQFLLMTLLPKFIPVLIVDTSVRILANDLMSELEQCLETQIYLYKNDFWLCVYMLLTIITSPLTD
jgi:hypothetical protein